MHGSGLGLSAICHGLRILHNIHSLVCVATTGSSAMATDSSGSEVAGDEILIKEVGNSSASEILLENVHISVPWHLILGTEYVGTAYSTRYLRNRLIESFLIKNK